MTSIVDRYATPQLERLRSRLRSEGLEALAAYRDAGDQVVVVTGAPVELVNTILAADSSDPVRVVGSTSRRYLGGLILERHCYGAHKLAMLYDSGYTAPLVIVYSDNPADLPLLVRAIKPILVNPRASRVAAFRRVLGADVEIQNWQPSLRTHK